MGIDGVKMIEKKKPISIASRKAKARNLQNWMGKKVAEITGCPFGKDELVQGREMGQSGVDVKLYGIAKEKFPFSVECKNQETWSLPAWVKQAKENNIKGTDWLLAIKKNHHEEIVVMDAKAFFDIYEQYLRLVFGPDHKIENN